MVIFCCLATNHKLITETTKLN